MKMCSCPFCWLHGGWMLVSDERILELAHESLPAELIMPWVRCPTCGGSRYVTSDERERLDAAMDREAMEDD